FTMALVVVILKYYETPFAALAIVALLYLLPWCIQIEEKKLDVLLCGIHCLLSLHLAYAWPR
ncbi:MAG: hypothetical protein LRY51_06555, partial [Geovibrio sp.]|nr:hypothetical protein [Geovibrio sp.]